MSLNDIVCLKADRSKIGRVKDIDDYDRVTIVLNDGSELTADIYELEVVEEVGCND